MTSPQVNYNHKNKFVEEHVELLFSHFKPKTMTPMQKRLQMAMKATLKKEKYQRDKEEFLAACPRPFFKS